MAMMAHRNDDDDVVAALNSLRDSVSSLATSQADQASGLKWGFKEVHGRQDITNGNIHKHEARLTYIEAFIAEQAKLDAYRRGAVDGGKALRKRDLAVLGVLIAVVGALAPTVVSLLTSL